MASLLQDLGYAVRRLARAPGFTAVAVTTLALGVGANAAMFSIVDTALLRPLPLPGADRVVTVWETGGWPASAPNFVDWRERSRSFVALAAYSAAAVTLTGEGDPERLRVGRVSAGWFEALGVTPVRGRLIAAEDDLPGSRRGVVLSEACWRSRFGAAEDVVGRDLVLDGDPHVVLGVAPEPVPWPQTLEAWVPMALDPAQLPNRSASFLRVLGRLAPEATIASAQAEMSAIAKQLEQEYPQTNTGSGVEVVALREKLVGDVRPALLLLLGAVGVVLLIACANVANLQLSQASGRQAELAVRAALGAGRGRLVRQLATESVALALAGGVAGVGLAALALDGVVALAPPELPSFAATAVDLRVLGFGLGVSIVSGLLFGLVPAVHTASGDLRPGLQSGSRSGARGGRFRDGLTVAQLAFSLALVCGAGVLLESLWRLQQVDPGFDAAGVTTLSVSLPAERYPDDDARADFWSRLLDELERRPGVASAGLASTLPLSGSSLSLSLAIHGRPALPPEDAPSAGWDAVSPGYFETLGMRLVAGRTIESGDRAGAAPVAVVSSELARRHWPDENPVGQSLTLSFPGAERAFEVVGVVGGIRHASLDASALDRVYTPIAQTPWRRADVAVAGRAAEAAEAARAALWAVDPGLAPSRARPLEALLADSLAPARFRSLLLSGFAALALVLAAVGLYGVVTYAVSQRTREIGIRVALGASRGDVVRQVVLQGLRLAGLGIALGVGLALAGGRVLESMLFETSASSPVVIASVSLGLLAVALVASALPARRALGVDPLEALRAE